jgi:hypothetical protein
MSRSRWSPASRRRNRKGVLMRQSSHPADMGTITPDGGHRAQFSDATIGTQRRGRRQPISDVYAKNRRLVEALRALPEEG